MRTLLYLIASIFIIAFLRMAIGIIMRGFQQLMQEEKELPRSASNRPPTAPAGGHLVRDPVCGTYVSEASSIKKSAEGQVYHFCSTACRDKHA